MLVNRTFLAASILFSLWFGTAQASFIVSYEAPGATATTATFGFRGVETFDSRQTTGIQSFTTDFGTTGNQVQVSGSYYNVQVNAFDQYGGAGNAGRYAAAFTSTPYDLTLSTIGQSSQSMPVTYFGYWLSALDLGNQVEFYRGDSLVFSFDPTAVLALTGNCPGPYCGNPVTGENSGEPYVFLNFYDLSGLGFDRVRFFETIDGGYESDNHTVGNFNSIGGTRIPEPSTLALVWVALVGAAAVRLRNTRRYSMRLEAL